MMKITETGDVCVFVVLRRGFRQNIERLQHSELNNVSLSTKNN